MGNGQAVGEELERERSCPHDGARVAVTLSQLDVAVTLSQIQELTLELTGALTPPQVASVVARQGVVVLGAKLAMVLIASADGEWLELVGHEASSEELIARFKRIQIDAPSSVTAVHRSGAIDVIDTQDEYRARYPELHAAMHEVLGTHAPLVVPLLLDGRSIGVLVLSFEEARRFSPEDRTYALTLARQCAQALGRARLFEAEHRLNERLRLLAQAGDILFSSLDYETTLENVVCMAIPALADVCFLSVVEDARVRRIGRVAGDHGQAMLLTDERWERAISAGVDIYALSSGRSGFYPEVDNLHPPTSSSDLDGLVFLRDLGLSSVITVPLCARGDTLGALTLGFASSRRRHTLVDLDLAEELAGRAANAIDYARLHRASREATRQAEQANQAKDEFLGVVSHELRTPLNAILGWSQLLRSQRGKTQATLDKGLAVIDRNARSQAKLIEDILDVSRIISGKIRLDLRALDLDAVIRSSVEVVRTAADAKGVELFISAEPGSMVSGDPDRLQQVVVNLLANAIKFTPEGGVIEVRLSQRDQAARVVVSDTGQGIEPSLLPHVFERFWQGDSSTTRRPGGLGLGLSIVHHLVELHGGSVTAESEGVGRGSTFTMSLPLRAESYPPPSLRPSAARDSDPGAVIPRLDGIKVLVVDDEPDALEVVETMLTATGAEVAVVSSASEALARLESFAADVLVSDVGMPGEDGFTLIRRIRASRARYASIPAIALTAYASIEDARRAALAGFHAHVAKPAEPMALIAMVGNLKLRFGEPPR